MKEVIKMTVAELIAVLATYPQDMEVIVGSPVDAGIDSIDEIYIEDVYTDADAVCIIAVEE